MTVADMEMIISADVTQAIAAMKKLGYTITQTGQAATKFTQKGKTDFTNLGRVIQDLPFGFIAIQNNLTQLMPAAGGLGLAISVLTSAFAFAQVGLSNWTRGLTASKEEVDAVSKSVAGAQTEIQKVSALFSVAKDLNQSTETRKNAIAELQKEYPGYLGNLNLENINSQEASHAVDLLAQALTRKAKVQAISNLLTAANEKLLKAENARVFESLNAVESFIAKLTRGRGIIGISALSSDAKAASENIGEAEKEVKRLEKALNELTQAQAKSDDWKLLNPTKAPPPPQVVEALINAFINGRNKLDKEIAIQTGNVMGVVQREVDKNPIDFRFKPPELSEEYKKKLQEFTDMVGSIVQTGFEAVGQTLGNLLSGKNNPFSAIFDFLGSSLIKLGTYVIAGAELISKITAALTLALKGFGGAGIAVGLGLIALGTVLKNIPKFATGGVVTSPTLALVGEQGPERITPLGYEGRANNVMQGEVVFQISGQSLRGILRRADNVAFNTF